MLVLTTASIALIHLLGAQSFVYVNRRRRVTATSSTSEGQNWREELPQGPRVHRAAG